MSYRVRCIRQNKRRRVIFTYKWQKGVDTGTGVFELFHKGGTWGFERFISVSKQLRKRFNYDSVSFISVLKVDR